ncbi:endonuclease [Flavobacterium sp.]|uniref:endonuclease n=1 Tax=Flavobacterium sp. TaxID=239 RepID=UPI002FDB0B76
MKKIYSFFLLFVAAISFSQQAYYNNINFNLNGQALKNQLAQLISDTHNYQLSYSEVWSALRITDLNPTNSNQVLLIYGWENGSDSDVTNDRARDKDNNGGNNGQWNREHVYAQSVGTPDLGQSGPGADAHMLRSCDVQRNNSRGNRKFAAGSGNSGNVGIHWYPGDEWKGDVARIIMYMYLRYGNQCLPSNMGDGPNAGAGDDMITLFLTWNAEDPVSQIEINRNTYLGNINNNWGQGNRNPFIDNPYLATKIWGGVAAQDTWGTLSTNTSFVYDFSVYPNPSSNQKINIDSESQIDTIQLVNINGQVIQVIQKPTPSNKTYTLENIPTGFYFMTITSQQQSVTKKVVVN